MKKNNCDNCHEELTDIEQKAKDEEGADVWCCYECFGDGSTNEYTEHGKYIKLLSFAKRMTDIGDICCTKDVEEMAEKLLIEIGVETK